MRRLHEVAKAIIKDDGSSFSLSDVKAINEIVENATDGRYFYIDTQTYTNRSFLVVDSDFLDDVFKDWLIDLVDECYLNQSNEFVKQYFNYDAFIEDCKMDGYAHTFNGYDGSTEIKTDNYTIYYHN